MMQTVGQRRLREAVLALVLFLGILHSGSCVKFEVKDSNTTCILAELSVNFTVPYTAGDKQVLANFVLPDNSTVGSDSTCGKEKGAELLVIVFGNQSLRINFTLSNGQYQVDEVVFAYNLSDKNLFPGASENGTKEVSTNNSAIFAENNSTYLCKNPHLLRLENVNLTFYNVMLEAYLSNNTYSKKESHCKEDISPTSAPTPSPTTVPVNPKQPDVGDYRVNGSSGSACLLARMGLQLNFTYRTKKDKMDFYVLTIDPKNISFTGECSNSSASLILYSNQVYLMFNFTLNNTVSKFYLGEVSVNATIPDAQDPKFSADNSSLSYLQTTTHKSYKCVNKQIFQVTSNFSIDTYNLQVQAFDIDKNDFGPALECTDDKNGMLVPIVVGACLAGLVLIVLIAYLIGRKRSHAGYQTI